FRFFQNDSWGTPGKPGKPPPSSMQPTAIWCSPVTKEIGHMAIRSSRPKRPKPCPVGWAVAAVEHDGSVMDLPVEGFDPSPTALDLDDADENGICSEPRRSCPMVDACIICGQPPCDDCS